jgi:hygromycin-B 4-O-kinase
MKPTLSPAVITAFLRIRYMEIGPLTPLTEGEESQAFVIDADGTPLVIRINRDRTGFDKDRIAGERSPLAPRVISIDLLDDAFLCISARASGDTLQALGANAAPYGAPVMHALDAIAASDISFTTGYGPFDASGHGHYASWTDFVTDIDGPADLLARIQGRRYPEHRQLVHGDFGSNNVLVADGMVTAVIDWSEAMVGDPLYDIANLFFWRPWLACMEAQCAHVEAHHAHRIADCDLLVAYQLRIGLQVLAEAERDRDDDLAAWALARCRAVASL